MWVKIRKGRKLGEKEKSECRLWEALVHFTHMRLPRCLCRLGLVTVPIDPMIC